MSATRDEEHKHSKEKTPNGCSHERTPKEEPIYRIIPRGGLQPGGYNSEKEEGSRDNRIGMETNKKTVSRTTGYEEPKSYIREDRGGDKITFGCTEPLCGTGERKPDFERQLKIRLDEEATLHQRQDPNWYKSGIESVLLVTREEKITTPSIPIEQVTNIIVREEKSGNYHNFANTNKVGTLSHLIAELDKRGAFNQLEAQNHRYPSFSRWSPDQKVDESG